MTKPTSSPTSPTSIKLKTLKMVMYKNKYYPEEYVQNQTKLLNALLEQEKERLNLKDSVLKSDDEENIAETVRNELLELEKKRIFYNKERPKLPKRATKGNGSRESKKVLFIFLERRRLSNMFSNLDKPNKLSEKQKQLQKCLSCLHPRRGSTLTSPYFLMKAINECLLTRNWNSLTHLLIELTNMSGTGVGYVPIIKNIYQIMDKLHPVICENNLQGEFMKIKAANQQILKNTTIV